MPSQTRGVGLAVTINHGNNIDWQLINNIYVDDGSRCAVPIPVGQISDYIRCTTFGFAIPGGATIDGITARYHIDESGSTIVDESVKIVKGGAEGGDEKKNPAEWPKPAAYRTYGGVLDLWGLAWTSADINAVGFGVSLAAENTGSRTRTAFIDYVSITVYYTEAVATNSKINIGDVFKDVDEIKINIADSWKTVTKIQINIGDVWKTIFG